MIFARRLLAEMRGAPSQREGEAALGRLVVRRLGAAPAELAELVPEAKDAIAIAISGERGEDVTRALGALASDVVDLAKDVYPSIPGRDARVRLLRAARAAARFAVVLHVPMHGDGTYLGRVVLDGPRKVARALHLPAAEPGDRFGPDRFVHAFFGEEVLRDEARLAGLAIARRSGFAFVLRATSEDERRREDAAPERVTPLAIEAARAVALVPLVDRARQREHAEALVAAMRRRGLRRGRARGPLGRARLRRAIGWVDALTPGGGNCMRRVLLELALDAGAAREALVFGLDVGKTGHVAFKDQEDDAFDVAFEVAGLG